MSVRKSYGKWCISIVRRTVPLIDHSVVKVLILAQPYKSTPNLMKIFSGLKVNWYDVIYNGQYFSFFSFSPIK